MQSSVRHHRLVYTELLVKHTKLMTILLEHLNGNKTLATLDLARLALLAICRYFFMDLNFSLIIIFHVNDKTNGTNLLL